MELRGMLDGDFEDMSGSLKRGMKLGDYSISIKGNRTHAGSIQYFLFVRKTEKQNTSIMDSN